MADTNTAAAPAAAPADAAPATPAASSKAPDPAKRYRVKLARPVQVSSRHWARPSAHEVILAGDVVANAGDAVISYEEV